MKIKDVMTKDVVTVRPDAKIQEAAEQMRSLNIGSLPVHDGQQLLGMVTDRDITVRATAQGRDPRSTMVKDVITPDVVYAFEDQDVQEAAQLMSKMQIRRLPILSRDKRLVGIVALGDVAVDTFSEKLGGAVLKEVSEPSKPQR